MYQTLQRKSEHISFSVTFSENVAVCVIILKNMITARQAADDNIIRPVCFACRITKNTHARIHTHVQYM